MIQRQSTRSLFTQLTSCRQWMTICQFIAFFVVTFVWCGRDVHQVAALKYDGVSITIAAKENLVGNFDVMAPIYTKLTGLTINTYELDYAQLQTNIKDDLAKGSPYFDCFSVPMGWAIDWIIDGHILKLTDRIKSDASRLQWLDISSFFRNFDASYQGDIWTFPFDGDVLYLYSRMDVLNKAGYTVPPQSWSEFLTIAATVHGTDMNGDGLPDSAICVAQKVGTEAFFIANGILATYLQSLGSEQGFFFDTTTGTPLSTTVGWKQAMSLYKSFQPYGMPNMTQAGVGTTRGAFLNEGTCAFTIDWGDVFVLANATVYRDVIRASAVPGPDSVYDRVNGVMTKCIDQPTLCPYATKEGINQASFSASGGWTSAISSLIPQIRQDACYDFLSWMIEPDQHNFLVQYGHGYEMDRVSQTDPTFWTKAGWTGKENAASLTNFESILASKNMAIDLNVPSNRKYLSQFDTILGDFLLGKFDVDSFGNQVYDAWETISAAAPTGKNGQLDAYRGILGLAPINRLVLTPIYLSSAIYDLTWVLMALGLATVLFFGLGVIVFRDRPVMRASSPALLIMMAVGASAAFVAMPLLALDGATAGVDVLNRVCPAQTYLFGVAFTLVFGSLAVRNWRIRKLFTDKLQVVIIKDWELFAKVGAILVVELLYCAIWNGVDPLSHTVSFLGPDSTYERCSSNHTNIWLGIYLAPKALLLIFVLYLAYATRTIELGQFNESKELAFVSYNVAFVIIVALPLSLALAGSGSVAAAALTRVLAVWFCMTLSLACVFVPKLLRVQDSVNQIMQTGTAGTVLGRHTSPSFSGEVSSRDLKMAPFPTAVTPMSPSIAKHRSSFGQQLQHAHNGIGSGPNSRSGHLRTPVPLPIAGGNPGASTAASPSRVATSSQSPSSIRPIHFHFHLMSDLPATLISTIVESVKSRLDMDVHPRLDGVSSSASSSLVVSHQVDKDGKVAINVELQPTTTSTASLTPMVSLDGKETTAPPSTTPPVLQAQPGSDDSSPEGTPVILSSESPSVIEPHQVQVHLESN